MAYLPSSRSKEVQYILSLEFCVLL